jgi:PAS domain S-box-containing protein
MFTRLRFLWELADDIAYGILTLRTSAAHLQAEQPLRESEARYRNRLDDLLEGCQIIGFDWRYLYVNDAVAKHGRKTKEELLGHTMMEIYPGIEKTDMFTAVRRCMDERTPSRLENEFTYPDGTTGWFELGIQPVPEGVFILSVDTTERKRAERAQIALYKISQAAVSTKSMDELYRSIHHILGELMPVENFYIALYEPASDLLSFPYFVDQFDLPSPPQKKGRGLTEYVLSTGRPLLVSPQVFAQLVQQGEVELVGTDSMDWLGAPLKSDERVIGVMVTQSYTEGIRYSQKDLDLLEFVSTQVALAIERKQAESRIQHLTRLYATLGQVNQTIVRVKEQGELFDAICKVAVDYGRFGMAWIGLVDHETGQVKPVAVHGAVKEQLPFQTINVRETSFKDGLMGITVKSGKPAYSRDIQTDPKMQHWRELSLAGGYYSSATVPFRLNDEIFGLLNLYAADVDFFADEEQQNLMEEMAQDISFALDTMELEARRKQAVESLRVSEFRFYSAFEYAPIGMALVAPDGRWLKVNQSLCEIVGYSEGELLTKTFQEITHPDDLAADLSFVHQMLAGEIQTYQMEKRYFHKTGRIIWILLSVSLVHDKAGQPLYFIAQIQDISKGKQAEDQIRQNTWRVEALAHAAALLNAQLNLDKVLETICEEVAYFLNAPVVSVYLADEQAKMLVPAKTVGLAPGAAKLLSNILLSQYEQLASKTGEPIVILDVQAVPDLPDADLFVELDFRSYISIGLWREGQLIGFLNVTTINEMRHWTNSEIALLKGLADQSAQALINARLFDQANTRLNRVQALRKNDVAITNSLNLQVSVDVILEQITTQTGVDAACVLLYNSHLQTLKFAVGRGFRTDALQYTNLRMGEGYAGRAAQERRIINISALHNRKTDFLRSPAFAVEGFVAYYAIPLIAKDQVKGVLEIFHRAPLEPDQEWLDFLDTLAGQAAIAIDNASLFADLQQSNQELIQAYAATIEGWSRALDLRDKETEGHTQRVVKMTLRLAQAMGISEDELVHVSRGALLHDIGKMGVPDNVLLKPGPLSEEEWVLMRKHPVYAYEMLAPIAYLKPALDIPYFHHEKWDGSGYPHRLKGKQIPLTARIFAVVDVWDALNSDRPYRKSWTREKALSHIQEQAGSHFDPEVVKVFLREITFDEQRQLTAY